VNQEAESIGECKREWPTKFAEDLKMADTLCEVRAVRVVCDDFLRKSLFDYLTRLGAKGYTWWQAHGKGEHPTDSGIFSELRRVYVEVWCSLEVAERIVKHCNSPQYHNSGMAVGVTSLFIPEDEAKKLNQR
jgi:hypothetical protein